MIDRKQIKATARERMAQASPPCWQVMLLWALAAAVMPQIVLSLISGPQESMEKLSLLLAGGIDPELALQVLEMSVGQLASTMVLNLVLSIFQTVLGFGLSLYALRLYRGQQCGASDLFAGFSMVGRIVGQQVLIGLIAIGVCILTAIPLAMAFVFASTMGELAGGLVMAAAIVALCVLVAAILLNYALASTALADQPELGAMGSIQYGKNLIRGYKGQFVVLVLSFLGWSLLCSIPVGIFTGVCTAFSLSLPLWAMSLIDAVLLMPYYLWLVPYVQTTAAGFYDALRLGKETLPQLPPL